VGVLINIVYIFSQHVGSKRKSFHPLQQRKIIRWLFQQSRHFRKHGQFCMESSKEHR